MTFMEFISKVRNSTLNIRYTTNKINHVGFHDSNPYDEQGLAIVLDEDDRLIDLIGIYIKEHFKRSFTAIHNTYSYYNYLTRRINNPDLKNIIENLIDKSDITQKEIEIFRKLDKLK